MRLKTIFSFLFPAILALFLIAASEQSSTFTFRTHTLATDLKGGYQVEAFDVNQDGREDLIALASGITDLVWFENPGWERHILISGLQRMINMAANKDRSGKVSIGIAWGFANNPERSIGNVGILSAPADLEDSWKLQEIDRLTTSHRLRWADIEGNGEKVLINAPLAGASSRAPEYRDSLPLVFYRQGTWRRESISNELSGVLHGIRVADWDGDGREDLLTAGFLGVHLFKRDQRRNWVTTLLLKGSTEPWPRSGASEIAVGRLDKSRFFATIEPWHGHELVFYAMNQDRWERRAIDGSLTDGHTLLTVDLNQDGRDEILAGYRGSGGGVHIYRSTDRSGNSWNKEILDRGIAAAGCTAVDLNQDGKIDLACIGSSSANLKWYENMGHVQKN